VLVSAVIVAYSAWVWRIAIAERLADEAFEAAETESPQPADTTVLPGSPGG